MVFLGARPGAFFFFFFFTTVQQSDNSRILGSRSLRTSEGERGGNGNGMEEDVDCVLATKTTNAFFFSHFLRIPVFHTYTKHDEAALILFLVFVMPLPSFLSSTLYAYVLFMFSFFSPFFAVFFLFMYSMPLLLLLLLKPVASERNKGLNKTGSAL